MSKHKEIGVAGPVTYYLEKPNTIMYAGAVYRKFSRVTEFLFHNTKDKGFKTQDIGSRWNCKLLYV